MPSLRSLFLVALLVAAVVLEIGFWRQDFSRHDVEPRLHLGAIAAADTGSCARLVLIQPWMEVRDYASAQAFRRKMEGYFAAADSAGLLSAGSVVVLPEHLGTWLVAADEWPSVFSAPTIEQAMERLVLTNLFDFLCAFRQIPPAPQPARAAIFHMKADRMWQAYTGVFRALARRYGVHIIAGSIVLPDTLLGGRLANLSFHFAPDARVAVLSRKAFPTADEQTFLAAAAPQHIGLLHLPQGKLAHLICADAWYPQAYAVLRKRKADWAIVSSFITGDGYLAQPWKGYDGYAAPPDVDADDPGRLTEGEAWRKYALEGRLASGGARCGAMVVLRGALWDLGSDGRSFLLRAGRRFAPDGCDSACIVATCLECR